MDGGADGAGVGGRVGSDVGADEGSVVGNSEGNGVGGFDGISDGGDVGMDVGAAVGSETGTLDGGRVGCPEGRDVGTPEGIAVGTLDGLPLTDGSADGSVELYVGELAIGNTDTETVLGHVVERAKTMASTSDGDSDLSQADMFANLLWLAPQKGGDGGVVDVTAWLNPPKSTNCKAFFNCEQKSFDKVTPSAFIQVAKEHHGSVASALKILQKDARGNPKE